MYTYDPEFSYAESVDFKGDQGFYLAPNECRTCYRENNKIVRDCVDHAK